MPIGAIGRAYATSCAQPGTEATLELRSATIDGEVLTTPTSVAPGEARFTQTTVAYLEWTNSDGSSGFSTLVEAP